MIRDLCEDVAYARHYLDEAAATLDELGDVDPERLAGFTPAEWAEFLEPLEAMTTSLDGAYQSALSALNLAATKVGDEDLAAQAEWLREHLTRVLDRRPQGIFRREGGR
jgi:hypothetical protein